MKIVKVCLRKIFKLTRLELRNKVNLSIYFIIASILYLSNLVLQLLFYFPSILLGFNNSDLFLIERIIAVFLNKIQKLRLSDILFYSNTIPKFATKINFISILLIYKKIIFLICIFFEYYLMFLHLTLEFYISHRYLFCHHLTFQIQF